jgi:hypothetical protein
VVTSQENHDLRYVCEEPINRISERADRFRWRNRLNQRPFKSSIVDNTGIENGRQPRYELYGLH